jgi:hypothetical protein
MTPEEHNKVRNRAISEGQEIGLLKAAGIAEANGDNYLAVRFRNEAHKIRRKRERPEQSPGASHDG